MRPLVCAVVFLVACSKPSGLELEVQPFDGAASARVYLGTTQVQNINELTVPYDQSGVVEMTSTDQVFVRAYDNNVDYKSFDGGHSLNFEFTTGVDFQLGAILVVGYDGSGAPIAAALLTDITAPGESLVQLTVTLSAIDSTQEQLFLWGSDQPSSVPTEAECAGLVGADSAAFIVAPGDTDCDGFGNHDSDECDAHYWNATLASAADGSCIAIGSDSACMLGGNAVCKDGVGTTRSATCTVEGSTVCLPTNNCATCSGAGSDALACLLDNAGTLGYTCTLAATGSGCAVTLSLPPTGGIMCEPPGNSQTGLAGSDGMFGSNVEVGSGMTVSIDVGSDCSVTLTAVGSPDPAGSVSTPLILRVALQNGNTLEEPLELAIAGDACTTGDKCESTAMTDDGELSRCLGGWGSDLIDTGLVGLSPTLTPDMSEILFIGSGPEGPEVMHSLDTGSGWSMPEAVTLVNEPASPAVALHLEGADTLWIVDNQSVVTKYVRQMPNTWMLAGTILPTAFPVPPDAFAPDTAGSDAVFASTSDPNQLYELTSPELAIVLAGSGTPFGTQIAYGRTPFLTDDDLTVFYAGSGANGNWEIYTTSRSTPGTMFPAGAPIGELGLSKDPQSPWLSQLPTSYLKRMFFTRTAPSGSDGLPHIYSVTR